MKKNTLSGREYLWNYMFWAVIGFIWYKNLLFTNIRGLSVMQSSLVLIGAMVVTFFVNTFISVGWSRNEWSIIASLLIPMGGYTYIIYNQYLSNMFTPVLAAASVALMIGVGIAFFSKVNSENVRRIKLVRRRRSVATVRTVGAITSAVMIGCIFGRSYIGGALFSSNEKTTATYGEEYTIANNIDTVVLLKPENWEKLDTAQERLDVLQCVVNIEGNYLGLNREISIYSKIMEEGTLAYYSDREGAVYINIDHMMNDSVYEVIDSVAHELFHAASHRYVEIYNELSPEEQKSYFFYDVSVYAEEFSNYVSGEDDYISYYGQKCEKDARSYGYSAVGDYYYGISELIGDNSYEDCLRDYYSIGFDGEYGGE